MASMSSALTRSFLVLVLACGVVAVPAVARAQTAVVVDHDPTALVVFRDELSPYGVWVQHSRYGTVWVPSAAVVGADFAPYVTSGHWALAEDGDWMWVSDYPFGWAVFHYGRWVWSSDYGWVWIPGREYSHAWVVWRVPAPGYAYVGWAPAPPSFVWVDGYAVSVWYRPVVPYVFCESRWMFDTHVHRYVVHDHARVVHLATGTRRYVSPIDARRRGPTLAEARVSSRYAPVSRTAANPRALALRERPGSTERVPARPRPATSLIDRSSPESVGRSAPSSVGRSAPNAAVGRPPARPSAGAAGARAPVDRDPTRAADTASRPSPSPLVERTTASPSPRPSDGPSPARSPDRARPAPDRASSAPASRPSGGQSVHRSSPPSPSAGRSSSPSTPSHGASGGGRSSGSRSGATPSARPSRR